MLNKKKSFVEYFVFPSILFCFFVFYPQNAQGQILPSSGIPCFSSFKFRFLGGKLNYTASQERIERLLGVWGIGCVLWKERIRIGVDLQFGRLTAEHHSATFNTTLNLAEISSRIWLQGVVFNHRRIRLSVAAAFETLLNTRQKMTTDYLDVGFGGDNFFELTSLASSQSGEAPQISLFGYFNIIEIVGVADFHIIARRLDAMLRIGYRRYALDIDNEVGTQIETLLAFSNRRSDEFRKNIVFHAAEISPGLRVWIIPQRIAMSFEAMVLPLPLETGMVSLFYGGNTDLTLYW